MIKILVGTIASGKSTYSKLCAYNGDIIINDDAIVNMLHANQYDLYDKKLKSLYKSIEMHIATSSLLLQKNVVIDRGLNMTKQSRQRWISLAKSFDTKVIAVIFPKLSAKEHAERRIKDNDRGHSYEYWLKVAQQHINTYQPVSIAEGFDDILYYKWDNK